MIDFFKKVVRKCKERYRKMQMRTLDAFIDIGNPSQNYDLFTLFNADTCTYSYLNRDEAIEKAKELGILYRIYNPITGKYEDNALGNALGNADCSLYMWNTNKNLNSGKIMGRCENGKIPNGY